MRQSLILSVLKSTNAYWLNWIRKSTYSGSWKEAVHRSALALKLLIFEPTGAVVASPTFSLPEYIGGTRNWDYRASWIRDSSFTLYALVRLGFTAEANGMCAICFVLLGFLTGVVPDSLHGVHLRTRERQKSGRIATNHVHHPWWKGLRRS